jgi:hypothetical protein
MIRIYAIAGLLLLVAGLLWHDNRMVVRAETAERALAAATARLQQVEAADAVHREHIAAMARQQAAYEALVGELDQLEGGDAPLSDYLRALDERLR